MTADNAPETENADLSQLGRKVASHMMSVVRGESLEAGIIAACDVVYDQWASSDEEEVSIDEMLDRVRFGGLRGIAHASTVRLAEVLRGYGLSSRQEFSAVFEALVNDRATKLARAGLSFSSVPAVAQLMARLVGPAQTVFDPACGFGGTLLAAALDGSRARLYGVDINLEAGQFATRRLALAGFDADIRAYDWLDEPPGATWEAIIAEPPMGMKIAPSGTLSAERELASLLGAKAAPGINDGDALWLFSVAESLAPHGRAVLHTPDGVGFRGGPTASLREHLLLSGRVEAIVAMPPGSVPGSSVATCVWVLRGAPDPRKREQVLMVNARTTDFAGSSNEFEDVLAIAQPWLDDGLFGSPEEWFARPVPIRELVHQKDATPQRHLSTPPEQVAPRPEASGRLLTELRLESFKSVGPHVRVPLRPLTLIYGKNSAGKSTLIQSILLMKQSIDAGRLSATGREITLGSVAGLAHNHALESPIHIGFSFASMPEIDSAHTLPNPRDLRSIDFRFVPADDRNGAVEAVDIGLGDEAFHWMRDESTTHTAIASVVEFLRMVAYAYGEDSVHPARKRSTSNQPRAAENELRRMGRDFVDFTMENLTPHGPSRPLQAEMRHRLSGTTQSRRLPAMVSTVGDLMGAVGDELHNLLNRVAYLGPLRQPPERLSVRAAVESGLDVPFFLLDNISERRDVSERLQRLGVPYDLDVVTVSNPVERSLFGDMAAVVLTDTRTGTRLSPADVGFGISQVLPIVTELSARTNSIVLIEQPEIHLHPAMQADLADLLIESVDTTGRGNQVIAETHSENIMLRVQRRVREGVISAKDIAVLYVDQDDSGTALVRQLRLDGEGDFLDDWPHGFFAERLDDIFGRLA